MKEVTDKTAWPASGIEQGKPLEEYDWGYLVFYNDGTCQFTLEEKPTLQEIRNRWSHYIAPSKRV